MCAEKGRAVGEPPLRPPRGGRSCCSSLLLQCPKSSQPNCFRGRRPATTILHPEASAQGSKRLPEVKAHPKRRLRTRRMLRCALEVPHYTSGRLPTVVHPGSRLAPWSGTACI